MRKKFFMIFFVVFSIVNFGKNVKNSYSQAQKSLNYANILWKSNKKKKAEEYYMKYINIMFKDGKENEISNEIFENIYLNHGIDLKNDENIILVNGKYALKLENKTWDIDYSDYSSLFAHSVQTYYSDNNCLKGEKILISELMKEREFVFVKNEHLKDLEKLLRYKIMTIAEYENREFETYNTRFDFYYVDFKKENILELDFSKVQSLIFYEINNLPKLKIKKGTGLRLMNNMDVNTDNIMGENLSTIPYNKLESLVISNNTYNEVKKHYNIFKAIDTINIFCIGDYRGMRCEADKKEKADLKKVILEVEEEERIEKEEIEKRK